MKTVLVSAGHSTIPPKDPGAVGNGFVEAAEALKVRDAVAAYLKEDFPNVKVIEDGFDGVNEPLTKAVALAKTANIAVEFHFNAASPQATGIEVLSKPNNKLLAQQIALGINLATKLVLRGDRGWKADNSGQHHRLAFCEVGGLIVEICFISNPSDMVAYKNNFETMCKNIAAVLGK